MIRKVKYQDTGEYGTSSEGYKGSDGKYYSSEEAWNKIAKNKAIYQQVYSKLQDILETNNVPTVVIKEVGRHKERWDIVLEILERTGETIREGIRIRHIDNAFFIAKYVAAFVDNNFREVEREFAELSKIPRTRIVEPPIDLSNVGCKHKYKDISKLIGVI